MARAAEHDDEFIDEPGRDRGGSFAENLDLQYYLRILRKHKWPIALFTAAITALASYYAFTATPVYSATSTLLIEPQGSNPVSIESLVGVETETQDYYETQFELLKSRALAYRIVDHLDLWNHPELAPASRAAAPPPTAERSGDAASAESGADGASSIIDSLGERFGLGDDAPSTDAANAAEADAGGATAESTEARGIADAGAPGRAPTPDGAASGDADPADPNALPEGMSVVEALDEPVMTSEQQQVLQAFMSRLTIAPVRKTKLVKISYESVDPALAALIANTVGEQYIESYLDAKMELTTKAASWLNERLQALKATLDESEDRLISFKQENGLVDVDGSVGRLNEQELLLVTAELAQARSELSGASDLYREVTALRDRPELLESIPTVRSDPLVQQVKIEQGRAQRALDELLNRYGERHPRVVDAKSQLASLDTTLRGHIDRVVGTIEKDYQLLRQRVSAVQSKLASGKQEIQAIGTKKFELDALEREVTTNQSIYDTFFNRMTEARSADGLDNANARVADYAVAPVDPVKPKKQLIIALAALASLVLSMLMAFLYEQMDDTIKGTADVEQKLNARMLGILPLIKGGLFGRKKGDSLPLDPTAVTDRKGTFVESVNTVRTALCLDDGDEPRKVIMVTSSVPGEGKSTLSLNLAYSLAQLERVLIIDCDLRRPTMGKVSGFERGDSGLSDLITAMRPARECIKRGCFNGALDVLPAGRPVDQPLELLSSKRFAKIVEQLRTHYDRIVLDCAPTQAVSDALVLSKISDAVIFAIKSHETSIDLARRSLQRLAQVHAPLSGVVVTQVDIDKIVSYGGDYYYQGYYDYYGYNEAGEAVRSGGDGRLRLSQEDLISIKRDDREVALDLDYGVGRAADERGSRGGARTIGLTEAGRVERESASAVSDVPPRTVERYDARRAPEPETVDIDASPRTGERYDARRAPEPESAGTDAASRIVERYDARRSPEPETAGADAPARTVKRYDARRSPETDSGADRSGGRRVDDDLDIL